MSKFFDYSRTLPHPFDSLKSKIVKVSSKYGDGTNAKLTGTMVKAVLAYCNCQTGNGEGAVGEIDQRIAAEYKSSMGADAYHLVVYDPSKGQFLAGCYDKNTETIEQYQAHSSARDGAALAFAMMPALLEDEEFRLQYNAYLECHIKGYPDLETAKGHMAILCDNAYRRIKDETCFAHLKVVLDKSGNVLPIRSAQLDSGVFKPTTVRAGEFVIFANAAAPASVIGAVSVVAHEDFIGQYANPGRALTAMEQSMVPTIPDWHILTNEVVDICKHIQHSSAAASPMRNFLLRGPAGTGKTHDARAIAAGLGLPYVKYTCSADTDAFDFIGQVYPEFSNASGDSKLDEELKKIEQMGGITYENVKAMLDLPDTIDMDFDPENAYLSMTGITKPGASVHDCMDAAFHLVTEKVQQLTAAKFATSSDSPKYSYFETDFIRGLKNGYLIEIQEPANITQPSVLTGLNDLLEQSGSILLPDKRRIQRHPDAVVIITTNVTYEGCRPLNQSVLDRMNMIKDIPMPSAAIMAQRAMSVTGCEDDYLVSQMVQVITDMANYCQTHGVSDGNVGMRSLIDWLISFDCTGNAYQSALDTIVSKATADEEEQQVLITSYLEPYFAPNGAVIGSKKK